MIPLEQRRNSGLSSPTITDVSIDFSPPSSTPSRSPLSSPFINLSYILLWYFFSTALSLFNKNLMGREHYNLDLPLLVSAMHTGLQWLITAILMNFGKKRWGGNGENKTVTWESWRRRVLPCGLAAAFEICTANASLRFITLTFYTMIKSSTPVWVLIFAFIFHLETPNTRLISIIVVIVFGVILTIAGETKFHPLGFILVLAASVASGLRWSLTQMLLQKGDLGMDNPVATLYWLSPIMFSIMLITSMVFEKVFMQFGVPGGNFQDIGTSMETVGLMILGGCLAFGMTIAEFFLIKSTSTITLSVAGISKEVVIISLSMLIFGDTLTPINIFGLIISIVGIAAYNIYKFSKESPHGHGGQNIGTSGNRGYEKLPMTVRE